MTVGVGKVCREFGLKPDDQGEHSRLPLGSGRDSCILPLGGLGLVMPCLAYRARTLVSVCVMGGLSGLSMVKGDGCLRRWGGVESGCDNCKVA